MNYNQIGVWIKGYLDAIQNGEQVTKKQLEILISKIKDMISEIEEEKNTQSGDDISKEEDDDLPF